MDCIGVRELRLWAHVGVLEHERRMVSGSALISVFSSI